MSTAPHLHHSTTVDHADVGTLRGRVVDFRHTTGVLADLRRTGTDTFELTFILGGGDDAEKLTLRGVPGGESLHLHEA